MEVKQIPINKIKPNEYNPKKLTIKQAEDLKTSIRKFGVVDPLIVNRAEGRENILIGGHQRLKVLKELGYKKVPVVYVNIPDVEQEKELCLRLSRNLEEWDLDLLLGFDKNWLEDIGFEDDELDFFVVEEEKSKSVSVNDLSELYPEYEVNSLAKRNGVPPFSVIDGRRQRWINRKKYWISKGIRSELGREQLKNTYASEKINVGHVHEGGSVFDPALCEIMYSWFAKENDIILDPFAGGSVRGIVASFLNRQYHGIDLSERQIKANIEQINIVEGNKYLPNWYSGDSLDMKQILPGNFMADMVFSCPPYVDLEVYSDDERDISNMGYDKFLEVYRKIIKNTYDLLKEDRFAMFVIGEVRDKSGHYYNFVGDTITAFLDAGYKYYNEMIYLTPIGSLPLRAEKDFKKSRKVGKSHQNILVFVKGNGRKAGERLGKVKLYNEWND